MMGTPEASFRQSIYHKKHTPKGGEVGAEREEHMAPGSSHGPKEGVSHQIPNLIPVSQRINDLG